MRGIYKYSESFGRMGTLESVFIADSEDMNKLWGKRIYLGDVLGKHSEVVTDRISPDICVLVSDDPEHVKLVCELGLSCGINLLEAFDNTL